MGCVTSGPRWLNTGMPSPWPLFHSPTECKGLQGPGCGWTQGEKEPASLNDMWKPAWPKTWTVTCGRNKLLLVKSLRIQGLCVTADSITPTNKEAFLDRSSGTNLEETHTLRSNSGLESKTTILYQSLEFFREMTFFKQTNLIQC